MIKRIWLFLICLSGAALFAQETDISGLLDDIQLRKESYVEYESYTATSHVVQYQMNKNWEPKKTVIMDKKIIFNDGQRMEDIFKAIEIRKGKEKDVTEDQIKAEMKRREKFEKTEQKRLEKEAQEGEEKEKGFSLNLQEIFPFDNEQREQYDFFLIPDSLVSGRTVLGIRTKAKEANKDRYQGRFYFDKETLDMLFVDVHPSKNQAMVKEFKMRMWFDVMPGNYFTLTNLWMKVYANAIIKKIRFEMEEQYSDYEIDDSVSPGS
jgi:hypothetical protein